MQRKTVYIRPRRTKTKENKRAWKGILIALSIILGLFVAAGIASVIVVESYVAKYEPIIKETMETINLDEYDPELASIIYYWDETAKQWVKSDILYESQDREWVHYREFPQDLVDAAMAIEDKRFYDHKGVDWKRTLHAAFTYIIKKDASEGGSTITQQLIKNLTGNDDKTAERKIMEIFEALELEKKVGSKEKIMELYLNNIYYGRSCIGIYTAANKYFAKQTKNLTLTECACLISIVKSPLHYDPYDEPEALMKRAALVIHEMLDQGYITEKQAESSWNELGYRAVKNDVEGQCSDYARDDSVEASVVFTDGSRRSNTIAEDSRYVYSWFTDAVLEEVIAELMHDYDYSREEANNKLYSGGLRIYTTLNPEAQKKAEEIYSDTDLLKKYENTDTDERMQSAVTVVDNRNGAVIALVGGIGEKTASRIWNRATDTLRSSGSSIKPLTVFAPAIELGYITENSVMEDTPFEEDENGNGWPVNGTKKYTGNRTIADAVAESINTIAVKIVDRIEPKIAFRWATQKFGLTSLVPADMDYAPMALGGLTNGVSTFEMAGAYSAFARDGVYTKPYLFYEVADNEGNTLLEHGLDQTKIMDETTVYEMTELMEGVIEKSNGLGKNAKVEGFDCAGKTGTSSDSKDLWFCGYTGYYTAAVWVGYDIAQEVYNYYPNPAADVWQQVMSSLVEGKDNKQLIDPNDKPEEITVCSVTGLLATDACESAGCVVHRLIKADDEIPEDECGAHIWIKVCEENGEIYLPNDYCRSTVRPKGVLDETLYDGDIPDDVITVEKLKGKGLCDRHNSSTYTNEIRYERARYQNVYVTGQLQLTEGEKSKLKAYSEDGNGDKGGDISYKSDNGSIVTVSSDGTVTAISEGTAYITVTADSTRYAGAVSEQVKVVVTKKKQATDEKQTEKTQAAEETKDNNN